MKEKYSMNHWSSATTESVEKNLLIGVNCVIVIYGEFVLGSLCASFYIFFFQSEQRVQNKMRNRRRLIDWVEKIYIFLSKESCFEFLNSSKSWLVPSKQEWHTISSQKSWLVSDISKEACVIKVWTLFSATGVAYTGNTSRTLTCIHQYAFFFGDVYPNTRTDLSPATFSYFYTTTTTEENIERFIIH